MKTSNKILLGALILVVLGMTLSAAYLKTNVLGDVVQGDGNVVQEDRPVEAFDKIEIGGNFKVYFTQESPSKLVVSADNNLMEYILSEVVDGELRIYSKNRIQSRNIQLDISSSDIRQITAAAGANVIGRNPITTPQLTLIGSAGGQLDLEAMVEQLIVNLSAGSRATLSGQADEAEYEASAGSRLSAYDLEAKRVDASGSAGSTLEVNATESLSAEGSAGTGIYYAGTPVINELNLSAGAAIHQRR